MGGPRGAEPQIPPARDGVEQRLDAILEELRGLSAALGRRQAPHSVVNGLVELREPERPAAARKRRG